MSIEKFKEKEKIKKKEKDENEKKNEIVRVLQFEKEKKEIIEVLKHKKKLAYLKSLIEKWQISIKIAKNIIEWKCLNNENINEMLDKIDEIEDLKDIDKILPKNLRLTKEEYLIALKNKNARVKILIKINNSLDYIYNSTHVDEFMNIFDLSWILTLFNSQLKKVQENTIDIKISLNI